MKTWEIAGQVGCLMVGLLVFSERQQPAPAPVGPHRVYWAVTVDALAAGTVLHTHVTVEGRVTLVRHEDDGDLHLKIVSAQHFIVAECIPALMGACPMVAVGNRVRVDGISRFDGEHKWWEVHPVERLVVVSP